MLVCYPERQSSMLEGSNACGLTKEEEETYVSASQCVSPIPSILDNRDHFTRAQIRTLSFVFVYPNCVSCRVLGNGKEKGGDVCLRPPSCVSSSLRNSWCVSLDYFLFFIYFHSSNISAHNWWPGYRQFKSVSTVQCPVSSGLGRGGCSRTRHIYSIVPNPTGSDA